METSSSGTTLTYRGSDQGGGVGGVNYTEYANGDDLNYKIYNLRGDVIKTIGANQATKSFSHYYAFGNHDDVYGSIPNDDFRANTKVEDDDNLLNEGKRFRHLELGIFLTPDPLEYVDGPNPYIYCNQNPWGRWDPEGLYGKIDMAEVSRLVAGNLAPLNKAITTVENNTVNSPRFMGTMQVVGGGVQATAGAMVSTSGVGASIGVPNVGLGIDNVVTGIKQVWTGEWQKSYFSQGLEAIGVSPEVAQVADISANLIAGTALSTKLLTSGAKATAGALNKNNSRTISVFRYVSEAEAKKAQNSGFIPNTLPDDITPKSVYVTPQRIESVVEAENKLQIGKLDPRGPQPSPSYRIEGNAFGITFDFIRKVKGGNAIELITNEKIPVITIEKL